MNVKIGQSSASAELKLAELGINNIVSQVKQHCDIVIGNRFEQFFFS